MLKHIVATVLNLWCFEMASCGWFVGTQTMYGADVEKQLYRVDGLWGQKPWLAQAWKATVSC